MAPFFLDIKSLGWSNKDTLTNHPQIRKGNFFQVKKPYEEEIY